MIQFELDNMLDLHRHWLRDKRFGTRADFTDRALENLTITYRNLTGAIFKDATICSCDFSNSNMEGIIGPSVHFMSSNFTNVTFKGAYLPHAKYTLSTFSNTDLWNVSGDGVYIISLQLGNVNVCYTSEILQINCMQYDIKDIWWMTNNAVLDQVRGHDESEMDGMSAWWHKWKYQIYQIVNLHPAKPVGSPE